MIKKQINKEGKWTSKKITKNLINSKIFLKNILIIRIKRKSKII